MLKVYVSLPVSFHSRGRLFNWSIPSFRNWIGFPRTLRYLLIMGSSLVREFIFLSIYHVPGRVTSDEGRLRIAGWPWTVDNCFIAGCIIINRRIICFIAKCAPLPGVLHWSLDMSPCRIVLHWRVYYMFCYWECLIAGGAPSPGVPHRRVCSIAGYSPSPSQHLIK